MVSQCRYASRRHSSIHSGSLFFLEMKATISSDRPLGALSDSISVVKPYLYLSTSIFLMRSSVSKSAIVLLYISVVIPGLDPDIFLAVCRRWPDHART